MAFLVAIHLGCDGGSSGNQAGENRDGGTGGFDGRSDGGTSGAGFRATGGDDGTGGGRATGGSGVGGEVATSGDSAGGADVDTASGGSGGALVDAGGGGAAGANSGRDGDLPWLHVDGNQIKDPSGNPVILRGVAVADVGAVEAWWGGMRAMIDRLTDENDDAGNSPGWYPSVVRLPVHPPDAGVGSPIAYDPDDASFFVDALEPAVDYCREKGLYAIIDWHHVDDTFAHRQATLQFWADAAPRFAEDSHVLFELFNEPVNEDDWGSVKEDMQSFYDLVRESAPDNLVLVASNNYAQFPGTAADDPIAGTNIAYTAHFYPIHWQVDWNRELFISEMESAAERVPVFVTEWGFQAGADDVVDGTISSYGSGFRDFVDRGGYSWTAWVAHFDWPPAMYEDENWTLAVGEGRMGGFTKDWLYETRDDHRPAR